jgi:hypothetical protein
MKRDAVAGPSISISGRGSRRLAGLDRAARRHPGRCGGPQGEIGHEPRDQRVLIGSLMAADLVDEYLLMIHPLVLGTGRRLFGGSAQASLRLVDSIATSTGVC